RLGYIRSTSGGRPGELACLRRLARLGYQIEVLRSGPIGWRVGTRVDWGEIVREHPVRVGQHPHVQLPRSLGHEQAPAPARIRHRGHLRSSRETEVRVQVPGTEWPEKRGRIVGYLFAVKHHTNELPLATQPLGV